jgi:hypothetical protein
MSLHSLFIRFRHFPISDRLAAALVMMVVSFWLMPGQLAANNAGIPVSVGRGGMVVRR